MKKNLLIIVLLIISLGLVACGTGNTANKDDLETNNYGNSEVNNDSENNDGEEESADNNQSPNENDEEKANENLIEKTGVYNGQADPHTIEIETENGPLAFQLTMGAREEVENLEVGEEVRYSYTEDGNHREIETIEPAIERDDIITETGVYNGQADPHTIEIETEDGPLAFQLTMDAREEVENLEVGEEVRYSYTESGNNRKIQTIKPR